MWPAFPASEYYDGSATPRRQQRASRLPDEQLAVAREGQRRVASHVHCRPLRRDRCPALPRWHRPARTSQSWTGPPTAQLKQTAEVGRRGTAASRRTTEQPIHQGRQAADVSRGFRRWFSVLTPVRPRSRARAVWWCRHVPTLSGLLPALPPTRGSGLPSASTVRCDGRRRALSSRTVIQRLVAHSSRRRWSTAPPSPSGPARPPSRAPASRVPPRRAGGRWTT